MTRPASDKSRRELEQVRRYVEEEGHEKVVHAEKAASELVGRVRHDIWDVHSEKGRWWVVTNPMNLYNQQDFKSRDVVLTFHIGLMLRVSYLEDRRGWWGGGCGPASVPVFCLRADEDVAESQAALLRCLCFA